MRKRLLFIFIIIEGALLANAQTDSISTRQMKTVEVKAAESTHSQSNVGSVDLIGPKQLIRAACCNLGESFTTNPSVDVSYSDAATGARQIKLLGLSGTYVQMLTENIPNLRGAALPYSLSFVPGRWMQSIQVSKGASSVKNGYESTTGQINIEYLKPQGTDGVRANAYLDTELKTDVSADGSIHINDKLSTSLLLHFENRQMDHDGNKDGFMDMPKIRQYNLMHRWAYVSSFWISQLSFRILKDERNGGQTRKHRQAWMTDPLYKTTNTTNRYEFQWKNGFTLSHNHNTSIALMLHGSWHDAWNTFGLTDYFVSHKNGYAQLMFETDFNAHHNLSVGASFNYDHYKEQYNINTSSFWKGWSGSEESVIGLYAQYTYKLGDKLTIMPGIRWDNSNQWGSFFTPRLHVKYAPLKWLNLRASAGKGYRTPRPLAENTPLLATGRAIIIANDLKQEEAWNTGVSASLNFPICGRKLELNTEYYYTWFKNQMVIDMSTCVTSFTNLSGKSFSHTFQVDVTYPIFRGFTATGAFRINDVKCTYDGSLRQKPLTSKFKGLLTLSYNTPLELWLFDVTGTVNGHGELWNHTSYPTYFQLQAQVTREFRHFSVYLGGENLTNYKIKNPIINASNPWSDKFDATQVWGPITGVMGYIGVRIKFEKL